MATLVPCLDALRSEFNRNFPQRDKGSDGWIGDSAHQASKSDHNPDSRGIVHAVDIDEDLRAPGASMRECVDEVVRRHRAGLDNRLTYVIYERTIWSASRDWRPRDYSGANPHDKHAHFSASYIRARENSRAPFGIEDIVTQADRDDIVRRVLAGMQAASPVDAFWDEPIERPQSHGGGKPRARTLLAYLGSRDNIANRVNEVLDGDALHQRLSALQATTDERLTRIEAMLNRIACSTTESA